MHSNIDKAAWGMPRALFARLGWQGFPTDWSRGVPVVTLPPRTLRALVEEVKAKLGLPFVRYDLTACCRPPWRARAARRRSSARATPRERSAWCRSAGSGG